MRRSLGIRRKVEVVPWKVFVPYPIAVDIELLLTNRTIGKPIYGARSQLITELLRDYLEKLKGPTHDQH